MQIESWILVKYCTKKTIKYFIGQVVAACGESWEVKFVKKVPSKRDAAVKFGWPNTDDIDIVNQQDIIKLLPAPETDRRGLLEFEIVFDGYNIS